jgi:hypothetical protein
MVTKTMAVSPFRASRHQFHDLRSARAAFAALVRLLPVGLNEHGNRLQLFLF